MIYTVMNLLFLFILGTIFWSFWSVLLIRLWESCSREKIKTILYGRSHCPGCDKPLQFFQLVPLISRFWQKGECSSCKKEISTMYPVLELVSWFLFLLWGVVFDFSLFAFQDIALSSVVLLAIWRLLGLILVWDIYTYELHIPLFLILCFFSFVLWFVVDLSVRPLFSLFVFFAVFGGIYLFGKWYSKIRFGIVQETFGFGDVLLAPVLWLLLALHYWHSIFGDWRLLMLVLSFVLWSCILGLLYYILSVLYDKISKKRSSDLFHDTTSPMIPFFPAMIVCYRIMIFLS